MNMLITCTTQSNISQCGTYSLVRDVTKSTFVRVVTSRTIKTASVPSILKMSGTWKLIINIVILKNDLEIGL